jgi:hypothetical protein
MKRDPVASALRAAVALCTLWSFAALSGCGGAGGRGEGAAAEPEAAMPEMTAEDVVSRAVLVSAELTTAVDEQRFLATGPIATEFAPDDKLIYLVGKLKRVPTQARIEVRWFRDADPKPVLVSQVHGSDTFSFVASLRPVSRVFISGPYSARIFVDDREVGGAPFTILGTPPSASGPKASGLAVSAKVGARMKPKRPGSTFPSGIGELYATFDVDAAAEGSSATVQWVRNGEVFHEENVDVAPKGRFGVQVTAPDGLPDGSYTVVVSLDGAEPAETGFVVGDAAAGSGPRVDRLALGKLLGDDGMPTTETTYFSISDDAVLCGLRFLDLPAGSELSVQWIAVTDDGSDPIVYHTVKNAVPNGGSGTMAAEWKPPPNGFEPGSYKVVVRVGGEALAELGFTIE